MSFSALKYFLSVCSKDIDQIFYVVFFKDAANLLFDLYLIYLLSPSKVYYYDKFFTFL